MESALLDTEFKNYNHRLPVDSNIRTNGGSLVSGYRPDISIQDNSGNVNLILESERKSERKAFIGALVKASRFAQENSCLVTLVFVMKETGNQTTVAQVSSNIEPYFRWLYNLGAVKLNRVCFISHPAYIQSAENNETILSNEFMERCVVLQG